jgi:hypothetical protein
VPVLVKLAGNAEVYVRAATAFERDLALARTGKMLAGLVHGREAAATAAALLGSEFAGADFAETGWLDAAGRRIMLIDLAGTCVTDWRGIVDESGQPIEKPSRATLALLLRSNTSARLIEEAILREVNLEIDEKNGSAASPTGGAAAADNTAAPANPKTQDAQEAS